jgi:hypothetical protein
MPCSDKIGVSETPVFLPRAPFASRRGPQSVLPMSGGPPVRMAGAATPMTMVHDIPHTPAFRDEPLNSPIQEVVLRVVVELEGWQLYVAGTACVLAGHVAITAKHVLEDIVRRHGMNQTSEREAEVTACAMRLYQVLPGPNYRVWNVHNAWACPRTDIAILHFGLWRSSSEAEEIAWKSPRLRVMPPPVGDKVVAFG